MNFTLLYSTTLMVSFMLTLILFIYHSRYWNPVTHIPLKVIYFLNMTSSLMCIVWAFVDGKPEYIPINYIGNIIEFNCMGFCGYFWLMYCLKFVDMPKIKTRFAKLMLGVPIVIIMLLIITTPLTHWAFYIDEGGFFHRGSIYNMQQTGYIYLCISSVVCLMYRKKCATSRERRRLTVLSLFPIPPAVFGSVQILAPSGIAPTLQFSVMISLLLVFVDELDQKITRDSLTQLKNRYEFERILQMKLNGFQQDDPKLYVLMADMDEFKSINDNYGHQQGDTALKVVANVIAKTSEKYDAVCARMSGDEFIALFETDCAEEAEAYRIETEVNLKQACANLPYKLKISIGIAEYDGTSSMMELLDQADQEMYRQKKQHKQAK